MSESFASQRILGKVSSSASQSRPGRNQFHGEIGTSCQFLPVGRQYGSMTAKDLQTRLRSLGNPKDAAFLAGFFKTGPGQYGEGDVFIGVRVPVIRKVAKDFKELPLAEVECLLHSPIHEERLAALVILVMQAAKADAKTRKAIYDFYLANTKFINNWDLVDLSAPQIVGAYLADKSRKPLYRLAKSSWLWDRRISILATFHFIRGRI